MIERSVMSSRDIMATYGDTWIEVETRDSDGFYPVKVVDTYSTPDGPGIIGLDLDECSRRIPIYSKEVNVNWSWPHLGMRDIGHFTVYFSRRAQRQWRRGVRRGQLEETFLGEGMAYSIGQEFNYSFNSRQTIESLFSPRYVPVAQAVEEIISGKRFARALDQNFAIVAEPEVDVPVLSYKGQTVGVVDVDNQEFVFEDDSSHIQPIFERLLEESDGYSC